MCAWKNQCLCPNNVHDCVHVYACMCFRSTILCILGLTHIHWHIRYGRRGGEGGSKEVESGKVGRKKCFRSEVRSEAKKSQRKTKFRKVEWTREKWSKNIFFLSELGSEVKKVCEKKTLVEVKSRGETEKFEVSDFTSAPTLPPLALISFEHVHRFFTSAHSMALVKNFTWKCANLW